jgi:alanine racemase
VSGAAPAAWAEIDASAVAHNARALAALVAPADLCAVIKADGYGHGAVTVARAALDGGARSLAVAQVGEGVALRDAGVDAAVLVLAEPEASAFEAMVAADLTPTVATAAGVAAAAAAASRVGRAVPVHLKVDTGMHRVGASAEQLPALIEAVTGAGPLVLEGIYTHLAVADGGSDEDRAFTAAQLASYDALCAAAPPVRRHAANTAGAVAHPAARYDMVRCGLALYGQLPGAFVREAYAGAGAPPLRPVLSLHSQVSAVRQLGAGARPSYGRLRALGASATVATVPIGYADGLPRAMFEGGYEVLIGGVRRPLAGAVTMDQIVVDCGDDDVAPGDPVVLLGRQGDEVVDADEWAVRLGTISYEVLCGIGPRVPRVVTGGVRSAAPGTG